MRSFLTQPHDCLVCAGAEDAIRRTSSAPRARPWAEQKAVQGRKKRVSSEGYACPNAACAYFKESDERRHALVSDG